MDSLRQYVVSVVCAALIFSLLSGLTSKGHTKDLVRFLCGLFLTITVIQPISRLDINSLIEFSVPYTMEAEEAALTGEIMAGNTVTDIIKAESEAYILDKAKQLHAELEINVTLSDEQIPVSAEINGQISPYAREKMETILETDLGITKENQIWTG